MTDWLASVIVLGWGGEPYIASCLTALQRQTYPTLEIIVVDNGSPDRTTEIVERDFPQVQLIRTGRNLGVAAGNNVGLKAARGQVCVLINADVEVYPDWLEHLVRAMQADPTIGIAGAKLLYPNGTIQFAGGRIEGPRGRAYHLGWHEPDQGQWDIFGDVDFVTGASLAITRQVLNRIGYEDEKFFPIDYEDPDISYRARSAGFRVVLVPQAVAIHHESSTTEATSLSRRLSLAGGRLRFVFKHWPTDRLRPEFFPAELEFLRHGSSSDRQVLQWVCLKMLYEIEDLAGWRERLGLGSRDESLTLLAEMLTQLRRACFSNLATALPDEVPHILAAWFIPPGVTLTSDSQVLFWSLCSMNARVEPHQPIAWPHWPPGIWPKINALFQKVTRRLLSWYVTPIVEQQNAVNADLLYAIEILTREVLLLQRQLAAGSFAPGESSRRTNSS
jgi:GT2 family glycosyltransferase